MFGKLGNRLLGPRWPTRKETFDCQLERMSAELLHAMLVHPVHGHEVRRIVLDINPLAKFPSDV